MQFIKELKEPGLRSASKIVQKHDIPIGNTVGNCLDISIKITVLHRYFELSVQMNVSPAANTCFLTMGMMSVVPATAILLMSQNTQAYFFRGLNKPLMPKAPELSRISRCRFKNLAGDPQTPNMECPRVTYDSSEAVPPF